MSGHRGFYFMMALVPVMISGLLYASVVTVENSVYQHKLKTILVNDPCNPQIEVEDGADELPQQAPQDAAPDAPPHIDGPCSVFHPRSQFDDLIQRMSPEEWNEQEVNKS